MNVTNSTNSTIIAGTAKADNISNTASLVTINAGKGNDSIRNNYGGSNVLINAGTGNDYIDNGVDSSNIAFAQNISIYSNAVAVIGGSNVSIFGGAGNDTIQIPAQM